MGTPSLKSICPSCNSKGKIRVKNNWFTCQHCEGTGKVSLMTHHIVAVEGYPNDIELFVNTMKHRVYTIKNPVDRRNIRVTPAFREIRFYDVVVQKEAEEDVLSDMGVQTTHTRFKTMMFTLWNFMLDVIKPMGFVKPATPTENRKPIAPRVKVFPIVKRLDKIMEDGYEVV